MIIPLRSCLNLGKLSDFPGLFQRISWRGAISVLSIGPTLGIDDLVGQFIDVTFIWGKQAL